MVAKRKAVSMIATAQVVKGDDVELDLASQIVAAEVESKIMKKPAAAPKEDHDDENMEVEDISEEDKAKRREKEVVAERTQELKATSLEGLKALLTKAGLPTGKKDDMIKALLKQEAKDRAAAREHESKIRTIVIKKKEELEQHSLSELGKMCDGKGIKCGKAKSERVEQLLLKWQEEDGVEKGLAQQAQEERKEELSDMENATLRKLCEKAGIDICVKEVMVERISKREYDMGRYVRAVGKGSVPQQKNVDMISALIANESHRKKEKEAKSLQDEEAGKKKKELKSWAIEDLKKTLGKKGLEVQLKKEEMVEALYKATIEEEALTARKTELKRMGAGALKEIITSNGIETSARGVGALIDAVLSHEAKCREELRAFETKVGEVLAKKKEELATRSVGDLKDMCASKGLAVGGGKEEKIERLLEEAQADGEVDATISKMMRSARKDELMAMDKFDVLAVCEKMEVDPLVKDIMVERILAYEDECKEPVTKKLKK